MPVALSAAAAGVLVGVGSSREVRSRPRGFLVAVLALAPLGVARDEDSSAARRASFSAFLRATSAFLAVASSLWDVGFG